MVTNAAKSAKGIFQAGFQLRHDPNRAASMKFIHDGGIGKVLFLQAYRHTGDLPRQTLWYFDRTRSGDNIVEQACHIIDLMVWAAGSPSAARLRHRRHQSLQERPARPHHHGQLHRHLRIPQRRALHLQPHLFRSAAASPESRSACSARTAPSIWPPPLLIEREKNAAPRKLEVPNAGQDSTYLSLAAFIDNARGKKTPLNNAESARISTLTAMMGRKSIYEKRVVEWT